jgi:thiol-disulfide isomerase/thioredoxin
MGAAAVGLITAFLLGAPLVSVFLAGLLLICPLLAWSPLRSQRRAVSGAAARGRGGSRPVEVVVVTSPSCHLCEDALAALAELAAEFPLSVREVDIRSPEGARIVERHRPATPPAVLVDGELFSAGRLPRGKLRRYLERAA